MHTWSISSTVHVNAILPGGGSNQTGGEKVAVGVAVTNVGIEGIGVEGGVGGGWVITGLGVPGIMVIGVPKYPMRAVLVSDPLGKRFR